MPPPILSPLRRRALLRHLGLSTALAAPLSIVALHAAPAAAQTAAWPSRPISILVGYSAGGAVDIIARALAQQLQGALGQSVIVENRPGAGTNIAMKAIVEAAPDGHTLMLAANALAANVSLFQPAPYALDRITPISMVGRVPVVLAANATAGLGSIDALIAQAKARPGSINYGTPGNGSTPHLAIELFQHAAGLDLTHVPYKGGAPAINDVVAGHIQTVAVNPMEVLPHVKSGKLRPLAVFGETRTAIFPDVPTIAESGYPGFASSVWYGLIGPAGLAPEIVTRLHAEVQKAIASPAMRERLASAGDETVPGSTAMFADLVRSEQRRYEQRIRSAGIKPDA